MKFSEVLKKLRKDRGMTQADAAKALGISRSTFGMYEQGNRQPDFETEEKIADLFNVSLDYLRTGENNFHIDHNTTVHTDGQSGWYLDPEAARMAQEIFDDPNLRILMDSSRNLSPEDIKILVDIATRMKGTNPNG